MGRVRARDGGIVIVDNYDSFTYNTVQLLGQLGVEARVVANDALTVAELASVGPRGVLLSAGPGVPESAGITLEVIRQFAGRVPLFGVCLGHQAIACAFGGRLRRAERLLHGKTSQITHDGAGVFEGLPNPVAMGRYNSLLVDEATLPGDLRVTARSEHREIMGLRHARWPIEGVQFHPESVLSTCGADLLRNWLARVC